MRVELLQEVVTAGEVKHGQVVRALDAREDIEPPKELMVVAEMRDEDREALNLDGDVCATGLVSGKMYWLRPEERVVLFPMAAMRVEG